jgi:hypothetical protein
MAAVEASEQGRNVDRAKSLNRADRQMTADHAADVGDRVARLLGRLESTPGRRQQCPSAGSSLAQPTTHRPAPG